MLSGSASASRFLLMLVIIGNVSVKLSVYLPDSVTLALGHWSKVIRLCFSLSRPSGRNRHQHNCPLLRN